MSISETIQRIQRLATARGWSSVDLARASGIPQRTCYNVLTGRSDTATARAEAMLRALETAPDPRPNVENP